MWKIFKTSVKITLTIWLIKSIWKDVGLQDERMKELIRELKR